MGMAASQARFLGLTARKSNVEYQVQQINQQRTSLANESAGLYNQMMELEVPTPPSVNSFYSTSYVLDNSGNGYDEEDFKILNMSKNFSNNGEYSVTLLGKRSTLKTKASKFEFSGYSRGEEKAAEDGKTKSWSATAGLKIGSSLVNVSCVRMSTKGDDDKWGAWTVPTFGDNDDQSIKMGQIYAIGQAADSPKPEGYEECFNATKSEFKYFFKDKNGQNHFLTADDFEKLFPTEEDDSGNKIPAKNNSEMSVKDEISFDTTYTHTSEYTQDVTATITEAENGRLTNIIIMNEDGTVKQEYSLSTVQEYDEKGYEQAYSDYEYEKSMYEKSITDINAKTEAIQAKDQSLELKIQQLDTEQNAISTEMDSVQKIIEDNVDKTFNVFG